MQYRPLLVSMTLLAGALGGSVILNSCQYSFKSNVNFAAFNESYQNKVREAGYFALVNDDRVESVLAGADAAALQTTLSNLKTTKDSVDGVAFAAAVQSILADESTTEANISERLAAVSKVLDAAKQFDDASSPSATAGDNDAGESVRTAMNAYADDPTADNLKSLLEIYAQTVIPELGTVSENAPITAALLYAASPDAASGPNTINAMLENLAKDPAQAKTGDTETETQYSSLSLVAQAMLQAKAVLDAATTASAPADLSATLIKEWSQVIGSAEGGMVQLASVITSRVLSSTVSSSTTAANIADLTQKIKKGLSEHALVSEKIRNLISSTSDEAEKNNLAGLLGRLTQLVSFVSSQDELDTTVSNLSSLGTQLAESGITVEKAKEYVTTANTTLGASVTSDSGGGGGGGSCASGIYFVGYSTDSSNKRIPGYWLDGSWTGLSLKDGSTGGILRTVVCSRGSLNFVGYQTFTGNVNEPGYWSKGTWTALPPVETGKTCLVSDAATVGSDFYVAGHCKNSANKFVAGYWKNGTWTALPNSHPDETGATGRITVGPNNDIYIAGILGDSNWGVGYWLNGTWTALTTAGTGSGSRTVNNVVLNGTSVLVGGYVPNGSSNFAVTLWTDNVMSFQPFPSGKVFCNSSGLLLDGTDIYQVGTCRDGQPVFQPFYWKNGTAVTLPILDNTKASDAMNIRKIGNDIYIPGSSTNSSSVAVPGYWKNGDWTALTPLDATKSSIVTNVGP